MDVAGEIILDGDWTKRAPVSSHHGAVPPTSVTSPGEAIGGVKSSLRLTPLVVGDEERRRDVIPYRLPHRPTRFSFSWNDDFPYAIHKIATGETGGHYRPDAEAPSRKLTALWHFSRISGSWLRYTRLF